MFQRIASLLLLTALLAVPCHAGLYYEAVTTVDQGAGANTVHAWVEGDMARIEIVDSDSPALGKGNYLVTQDAGRTMFLVNPKDQTYFRFDVSAMVTALDGMPGLVDMQFSDPVVEKLDEGDGPTLLGHETRYFKYRTEYDLKLKVLGMRRNMSTDSVQEIWTTDAYDMPGIYAWLGQKSRSTGDTGLDDLIAAEMDKVQGLPLKTVTVSTTTNKKGKGDTVTSTTEVTTLREESVPADRFVVPEGYRETQLPGVGGDEDSGNPLKGLFGGG